MEREDVEDALSLLQRAHVLDACLDGPVGRTAIAERAGCSRTTAYRATSELDERGLLERTPHGYRLTGVGTATLEQVRQFREGLDGVGRLRPLLDQFAGSELARNVSLFDDATVLQADSDTPYGIEQHLVSMIEETDREIFGVASNVGSPLTVDAAYERILDGVEFEYVFTREAFERLTAQYGDVVDEVADEENASFLVVDRVAVDLVVYDDTLVVVGFDDGGLLRTVATTEDDDARAWARDVFESHRRRGEVVG